MTQAVNAAGGRIVAQQWHMGRQVPSSVSSMQPVSSSATRTPGHAHTYEGKQAFDLARPLELDELPRLLDDYARATRNALAAGFDGVQNHATNGYLIDQFLRDGSNPVMLVMLGEMCPDQIRGSGLAVSGFAQWIANATISVSFPTLVVSPGLAVTYVDYAFFAALSFVFVRAMVHEMRGRELEEMVG